MTSNGLDPQGPTRPGGLQEQEGTMSLSDPRLRPEEIERLRNGLHIMAVHALGDQEAAEEVVQETLVRTLQAMSDDARESPRNLGAFVRGIARHVIADVYEARRNRLPLESVPHDGGGATLEDPLGALVTEEDRQRVGRALRDLSPSDRAILRLCYYEGLAPMEIADRTGEPAPRIRKRKSRALVRLRRAMTRREARPDSLRQSWRTNPHFWETT